MLAEASTHRRLLLARRRFESAGRVTRGRPAPLAKSDVTRDTAAANQRRVGSNRRVGGGAGGATRFRLAFRRPSKLPVALLLLLLLLLLVRY